MTSIGQRSYSFEKHRDREATTGPRRAFLHGPQSFLHRAPLSPLLPTRVFFPNHFLLFTYFVSLGIRIAQFYPRSTDTPAPQSCRSNSRPRRACHASDAPPPSFTFPTLGIFSSIIIIYNGTTLDLKQLQLPPLAEPLPTSPESTTAAWIQTRVRSPHCPAPRR